MLQKVSKVILMALVILFAVPNLAIYAQEQETETPPSIQSVIEPSPVAQPDDHAEEPRSNRSKRIVETVADVINTLHSAKEFYKEPSRTNGALLVWDVLSVAVPGVPGSYAAKGVKAAADKIQDASKTVKSVEDIVSDANKLNKTRSGTQIYEKTGGYEKAVEDFHSLDPNVFKEAPGLMVGELPDGRKVNVREKSKEGRPTIEIQKGNRSEKKIRY